MSFLRRISNATAAFLPAAPSAQGVLPSHVPQRATETFAYPIVPEEDDDDRRSWAESRASWELSDGESSRSGASSRSSLTSSNASSHSHASSTSSEDSVDSWGDEEDGRPRDRYDMMIRHLWSVGERQGWFRDAHGNGLVSIRMKKKMFRTYPQPKRGRKGREMKERIEEWDSAISTLNPEVAIKVTSKVVQAIMARCPDEAIEITLDTNTRIQILDELSHLAGARKHQFAAFIRDEQCLVVWTDELESLVPAAEALEARMISFVWEGRHQELLDLDDLDGAEDEEMHEKSEGAENLGDLEAKVGAEPGSWETRDKRPVMLYAPLISGLGIMITLAFIGLGLRHLIEEALLDGGYTRFALVATTPFSFWLCMFFSICIVGNTWHMIGPVAHCHQNSAYYSGKIPERLKGALPHITIQMPVYKEGLEGVIIPTVESLKKAITTYERQGGSVNILVYDDGMQIWDVEEQEIRKAYYDRNNIGWTARPKHGYNGFIRPGRFKKASNMNYGNTLSLRVEELMDELRPGINDEEKRRPSQNWTAEEEKQVYDEALARALDETKGEAWAAGNIRIGEIILIIDSDTRVPEDCFLDAASEFHSSPNVAIIQHESAVMQVVGHFFENGITSFTTRINSAISFCCANGEVAPFVGHNAFLRWAAIQDAAFVDPADGKIKCWSESHVSEDFDQALRLQMKGWATRWASYSNGGFQEGVSLTADDELNRWQKYAYGCSELVFHPFRQWLYKGPFTPLFLRFFMADGIPIHSKISVFAYITSYYAIACALTFSLMNWILVGLFEGDLDAFYLQSWYVYFTCVVIFSGLANVSSAIFQYRLNTNSLGDALITNFKWVIFFFFFFCGLPYHLSTALCAHLIGYNMQWASTVKEVELSHFFKEWPAMWKRFWDIWIISWIILVAVGIMASNILPPGYQITAWTCILPIVTCAASHFLYPIVLNPWLLLFQF